MTQQDRRQLRAQLRQDRRDIPARTRVAAADTLATQLLQLPFAPDNGHVAGYWAIDGEIALHAWQLRLPATITYCLPVLHDTGQLRFAPWTPGAPLATNQHGIPEPDVPADQLLRPEQMQLVVLPLVGFDPHGHRLGMGAGWYDRSFAFRQTGAPPPWLVGVGFAIQQVDQIATHPWDVDLDAVCSEYRTIVCNGASA